MSFTVKQVLDGSMGDNQEPNFQWAERPDWIRWINEALTEICEVAAPFRATKSITFVEDQSKYDLPSDVIRVKRVAWGNNGNNNDGNRIPNRDQVQNDYYGDPTTMTYTVMRGTGDFPRIQFTPTPDSSDAGDSVDVFYVQQHAKVSKDSDTISLPRSILYDIIDFVNYKFTQQDDELQKMQFNRQEWERSVRDSIRRINKSAEPKRLIDGKATQRRKYRSGY